MKNPIYRAHALHTFRCGLYQLSVAGVINSDTIKRVYEVIDPASAKDNIQEFEKQSHDPSFYQLNQGNPAPTW
jgi:hypothetical protein